MLGGRQILQNIQSYQLGAPSILQDSVVLAGNWVSSTGSVQYSVEYPCIPVESWQYSECVHPYLKGVRVFSRLIYLSLESCNILQDTHQFLLGADSTLQDIQKFLSGFANFCRALNHTNREPVVLWIVGWFFLNFHVCLQILSNIKITAVF
jgi:hypothetical protein